MSKSITAILAACLAFAQADVQAKGPSPKPSKKENAEPARKGQSNTQTPIAEAEAGATNIVTANQVPSRNDLRRDIQYQSIFEGLVAGDLCWAEVQDLLEEQHTIASYERRYRDDGKFSWNDALRLRFMQDYASRNIHRNRRDENRCPPPAHVTASDLARSPLLTRR